MFNELDGEKILTLCDICSTKSFAEIEMYLKYININAKN
jgi:hypothetical protein